MRQAGAIVLATAGLLLAAAAPATLAGTTELVSVNSAGQQGNGNSFDPSISGDGSRVAFESIATNLSPDHSSDHVYLRDRTTRQTIVVDRSSTGELANSFALVPLISRDGTHVLFSSEATNLVPGDTNGEDDVFERDLTTGTTVRVSVKSNGLQSHNRPSFPDAISADGRFSVLETSARNLTHGPKGLNTVFVHDLKKGTTVAVSQGLGGQLANGRSFGDAISGDGRFIGFESDASNLVTGDNNNAADVFVYDRLAGKSTLASVNSKGQQGNADSFGGLVSDDGDVVVFDSSATNLAPSSPNGGVFARDRQAGTTTRIDRAVGGGEPDGDQTGAVGVSADGRYVLIQSDASNLVANDTNNATDLFVYDRQAKTMTRVDVSGSGAQANQGSTDVSRAAISADGSTVAFGSASTNLVSGDSNDALDVFVHVPGTGPAARVAKR